MKNFTDEDRLLEDIKKIKSALGSRCKNIAIFGSAIKRGLDKAADIDLALFMESPSAGYVIRCLKNAELNYHFNRSRVAYSYGGGGGINNEDNGKEFDIVVLDSNNPDLEFMSRNNMFLRYIH